MTKVFFKIQTIRLAAILSLHYLNISIEVCIHQGNHCDYSRFSTDVFISDLSQIKENVSANKHETLKTLSNGKRNY